MLFLEGSSPGSGKACSLLSFRSLQKCRLLGAAFLTARRQSLRPSLSHARPWLYYSSEYVSLPDVWFGFGFVSPPRARLPLRTGTISVIPWDAGARNKRVVSERTNEWVSRCNNNLPGCQQGRFTSITCVNLSSHLGGKLGGESSSC